MTNSKRMNICVITYTYPGRHDPSSYAFVKQLVDAMANMGHHCFVLVPFNISHYKRLSQLREEYTQGAGRVTVIRPGYISLSTFHVGKFNPSKWLHGLALKKAFKVMDIKPDLIYCHFWSSGYEGFAYAKKKNVPLFVATGESDISRMFKLPNDLKDFSEYVKGVICVSSKNRDESISLGLTDINKCRVFPNAVDTRLFHQRDRSEIRKKLGFPQDAFIVAFVGLFIERKGPLRLVEAIKKIKGVNSIFIGKGTQNPQCEGMLFKGLLPHDKVPYYLSAADCFVLPTLAEGCCNAVVEAMACGLPVISSNLPFNWDVLDNTNSIMIDPSNIDEIADAIRELRDNPRKKEQLSKEALEKVKSLTIQKRAEGILKFMVEASRS